MDTSSILDDFEKIKISWPCRESNHNSSAVLPAAWSLYKLHYPRAKHTFKVLSSRFQSHRAVIKFQGHCATDRSSDTLIVLPSDRPTLSLCYSLIVRHSHCATVWSADTLCLSLIGQHSRCATICSADTLIVLQSGRPTLSLCYSLIGRHSVLESDRPALSLCYNLIGRHSHCATVWSAETLIVLVWLPTLSLCYSQIADIHCAIHSSY